MSRKTKAIISAGIYVLLLAVLPSVGLAMAPADLIQYASIIFGKELRSIVITFSILGIILGCLSVVRGVVKEESYVYLISGILMPVIWYYLTLYGLGFGRPGNFGRTFILMSRDGSTMSVLIDIRIILVILGFAFALEIASTLVEFLAAREKVGDTAPEN